MDSRKLKIRLHRENMAVKEGDVYIARPPQHPGYCYGCDFYSKIKGCTRTGGECLATIRYDSKHKIFKRLS